LIFFAQTFFSNPEWTLNRIKVIFSISASILTNFHSQDSFSSSADRLAAWGLETDDLSFVRRDLKSLLFKYMKEGDAVVEYE